MLRLALPVIVAELGWVSMGLVDTVMVGPLGPEAIGAVGTGTILYMAVMMIGFGTLLALDTFVSQNYGAGRIDECHRWLSAGAQLDDLLTLTLTAITAGVIALLPAFSLHPDVLALIEPYMTRLLWSTAPLMAYVVCRRYLQAMNIVRPIMIGLVVANAVNVAANWLLIFGRFGLPALGVNGAAYATVLSRLALVLFLIFVIVYRERERPSGLRDVPLRPEWLRMRSILTVGLPVAGQILLEVGVFAAVSALAGRIAPTAVAAHQIVLNIIGTIFMVPFGIGTAAAVRVGQAVGRGDAAGVRAAGWTALGLATVVMAGSALAFLVAPVPLLRLFSSDPSVLSIGVRLLLIAAVFQLFDGVQTVTTGALRGLGQTQVPMALNLVGHWIVGLPTAYLLCFPYGWGVQGLWLGLATGLVSIGAVLLFVWKREIDLAAIAVPRRLP